MRVLLILLKQIDLIPLIGALLCRKCLRCTPSARQRPKVRIARLSSGMLVNPDDLICARGPSSKCEMGTSVAPETHSANELHLPGSGALSKAGGGCYLPLLPEIEDAIDASLLPPKKLASHVIAITHLQLQTRNIQLTLVTQPALLVE